MNDHDVLSIGEKLRTARKNKKLSLRDLAARAEVSPSLLSQIENGRSNPSVLTLYNIAGALELPITFFFPNTDDNTPEPQYTSTVRTDKTASEMRADTNDEAMFQLPNARTGQQVVLDRESRIAIELRGGVRWERLTVSEEEDMQFLEIHYQPGASSGQAMSHHSGREFGLVLEGELTLDLGFEQYILTPGNSIMFNSNTPHRLSNEKDGVMRAIWVLVNRRALG